MHNQPTMVTQLLLLAFLHGADGRLLQTRVTANWMEAKLACSRAGGRLPLPGDDVDNNALAEHLQAYNVTSAWIEAKWVITPWHIDGVIIREQGCFGYDKLKLWNPEAQLLFIDTLSSCASTCNDSDSGFAGYRKGMHSNTCVCLNSTRPIERRLYSDCRGANYSGYRVVNSTWYTQDPIANLRWRRQSGNHGGLCALTFLARPNATNLRLEEDYCYNRHPTLCCIQNNNGTSVMFMPLYTWFEAHLECTLLGGIIASQRSKCVQLHTTPTDFNTTRFWSGVRAWVWYINETKTLEHRFTNWSHEQPLLESEPCAVVTREGKWESTSCDESRTIVCETDEPTSTAAHLSPSSTQSSSNQIISTGDGPKTLQQLEPGTRFGIAGIAVGAIVGGLVVLALVGAVIWVLMRRKCKTDRGYPTRLDNPVYNKDNDDVIISRAEIGPHETTIRENSMYGWSGNNIGADSDPYFNESTVTTVGGTGSECQSKPREVSSAHMTVVDNELYGESGAAQTSHSEPVYSLEQLCDGQSHDEPRHNNDDEDDDDNDEDGDFESVNEAIKGRELQPHSHDIVV